MNSFLLITIGWVVFCLFVYKELFTRMLMISAGVYGLTILLTGCASNDVVYKKDCRMERITKTCIEIPINPKREGEGTH